MTTARNLVLARGADMDSEITSRILKIVDSEEGLSFGGPT
jgi:hypothetical protein